MARKKFLFTILVAGLGALLFFLTGLYLGRVRGIPFIGIKDYCWSIGIYTGDSPLKVSVSKSIKNPVLTAKDVLDVRAEFVADPFMVKDHSSWYMFFEVMNGDTQQGDIGLATSQDGVRWGYKRIILDEPFHVSYPYVFEYKSEFYMIPETKRSDAIRLYRATHFPFNWSFVGKLKDGKYADPSIFYFGNRWWLFASKDQALWLFFAGDLRGPWIEHPQNPIITGGQYYIRPAGRVLVLNDNQIIRYAQDSYPYYGKQVRACRITKLSTRTYEEEKIEEPILEPTDSGWNAKGMHHIDPHQLPNGKWIACVDGFKDSIVFGIKR